MKTIKEDIEILKAFNAKGELITPKILDRISKAIKELKEEFCFCQYEKGIVICQHCKRIDKIFGEFK